LRRYLLYIGLALAAGLLFCALGLYWLLETAAGARFAVTAVGAVSGQQVSVQGVQGRLLDRLQLSGLHIARPKLDTRIDRLDLDWEPLRLLSGELAVRRLLVSGVRIQDDRPPSGKPPQLRWPRVSGVARRLEARIGNFKLTGLSYRRLQAPPLSVSELTSSLQYQKGLLSISGLRLLSPGGRLSGEIAAGLSYPSLRVDLAALPAQPVQDMDFFSLQARLLPGKGAEQLSGGIALAGRSGGAQRLELSGELGMTGNVVSLRRLNLVRAGRRGTLTGEGSMTATEPVFSLALKAADLDLAKEVNFPTRLSGTLNFQGELSRYRGSFSLSNQGPGWQSAALAADYQGGTTGLKLSPISGKLLDGSLRGALDVAWSAGVRVRGTLAGRGLNPGVLAADWRGVVNLDLSGGMELPRQGVLRGDLTAKLLQSRLHDQELRGEAAAAFAGERLRVDRLFLSGRGFELHAAGELDRRLNLAAKVSDLSRLLPGGAGQLQADGWLRWRDKVVSGALSGQGSNLAYAGVRAAALQLKASLGEKEQGYPLQLQASAGKLQLGRAQVESALLTLQGTAARHTLQADLSSAGSEAHARLGGGYAKGVWSGELTRLSGSDAFGPWSLAAPSQLLLSRQRLRIAPLAIDGANGERIELAADLSRQPRSGFFRGGWRQLNLARADAFLVGTRISGASSGDLDLRFSPGGRLTVSGRADAHGRVLSNGHKLDLQALTASIEGSGSGLRATADLSLQGGSGQAHLLFVSLAPASLALPKHGELTLQWSDLDLALLRPMLPETLLVDGRLAGLVTGRLLPGGVLELKGNTALAKGQAYWRAQGEQFSALLETAELSFGWRGRVRDGKLTPGQLRLNGRASATGSYTGADGRRIVITRSILRLDADQGGTRGAFDLSLDRGGSLRAALSSASPAGFAVPSTGELALEWGGLDPALFKPWLPAGLNLQGELSGHASGRLLPAKRVELAGEAVFSQGRAQWQGQTGEVNANLRSASLSFAWRGETLSGALLLALADYGRAQGNFVLPIPARLPIAPDPKGTVQGSFGGKVQEHGFLSAFLPGLVQESKGDLDLDLRLRGTWSDPRVLGSLQLARAGAYLPTAGIRLTDLQLTARLEGDLVRIENLRARSGDGEIHGDLQMRLAGWQVASYSGSLSGERFRTVFLPELQLSTSPKLSFQGDSQRVTVRGELRVPDMLISGPPVRQSVTASSDVIMEGAPTAAEGGKFPLLVEGRLHVVLGDKVQVKASGIDAQLVGEMDLVLNGIDNISSSGEIRVAKGRYRAYGVDLDIVRGRLYYVDEPVSQPTLDILALHTVGDVRAGVTVAGYLSAPIVKLYSEPPMPEVDILAYMVLGHPMGTSTEQGGMLATAATSLFSFGQSESLQDQIKERLGLSVLGVETVNPSSAGLMGYKEIPTSPTGAPSKQAVGQSLLTVGKYLTPKLYLSYGRSLVTGGNLFMLRYDILRHWQLETQSGSESGADIYYKVEFN
jgi:translocation and assembly module TamB